MAAAADKTLREEKCVYHHLDYKKQKWNSWVKVMIPGSNGDNSWAKRSSTGMRLSSDALRKKFTKEDVCGICELKASNGKKKRNLFTWEVLAEKNLVIWWKEFPNI